MVTKDVEPYTVVGGNPARKIKQRFPDHIIEELLRIRWWDWDIKTIQQHIDAIVNGDVEALKRNIGKDYR